MFSCARTRCGIAAARSSRLLVLLAPPPTLRLVRRRQVAARRLLWPPIRIGSTSLGAEAAPCGLLSELEENRRYVHSGSRLFLFAGTSESKYWLTPSQVCSCSRLRIKVAGCVVVLVINSKSILFAETSENCWAISNVLSPRLSSPWTKLSALRPLVQHLCCHQQPVLLRRDGGGSDPEAAEEGIRRRGQRLLRVESRRPAHARRRLHRRGQALARR